MTTYNYKTLLCDRADGVLTLTLNRPERLNAFNTRMRVELCDFFAAVNGDDATKAIVVTGAGRGFCAGADLSSGGETFNYDARTQAKNAEGGDVSGLLSVAGVHRDGGGLVSLAIYACLKPVIAAVNGPAVGVGATMQLPMDIRLASEAARFGFVFARRGVTPEACSSWFLPRLVGMGRSLEWVMSGRVFDAAEALEGGLVRTVYAPDALLPAARTLAREISEHTSPVSVAMSRQMLWRNAALDDPMEAHIVESRALVARGVSADAQEGIESFLAKRPAKFPLEVSKDMPDFYPWWSERRFL